MVGRFTSVGVIILGFFAQTCLGDLPGFIGFETAEQYQVGLLSGQQGWTAGNSHAGSTQIVLDDLYGRGVRMTATGGFDGTFHLAAASPVFDSTPGSSIYTRQDIVIDQYGESDFLVQSVDVMANKAAVALQFASQGRLIINNQLTTYTWTPQQKMTVDIQHNFIAEIATVTIDSQVVAASVTIGHVNQINQLQYAMDDTLISSASSLFFDNVTIVPEANSLLLILGLSGALIGIRPLR